MTYSEIVAHIFSRGRFGMKPGLERVTEILSRLGNPHRELKTVQIAGTNGKGSTGAFLAAICTSAGYRTAFFSSPHLSEFTERFRIDGVEITQEKLAAAAAEVVAVAPAEATFFEIVTAIAFLCFARERVDLAIMETGMGGRWDATNVCESLLSVITPISFDHCLYLGDTLAAIAAEKAGIIKTGRPVVVADQPAEALAVISRTAAEMSAPLLRSGRDFRAGWTAEGLTFNGCGTSFLCKPALLGRFQAGNAAVAIAAAKTLVADGFVISDAACQSGVAAAVWPGRLELFPGSPPLLLDGAHNPAGVLALVEALADFKRERLLLVAGVMADKSWQEMLLPLLPLAAEVIAVEPSLERALPAETLLAFCRDNGCHAAAAGAVAAGLEYGRRRAAADDLILVTGSLFTVGEARALLTGSTYMPIRG
jgi:dihydrofolate synthase/folylpolyglutamate synthase